LSKKEEWNGQSNRATLRRNISDGDELRLWRGGEGAIAEKGFSRERERRIPENCGAQGVDAYMTLIEARSIFDV